MVATVRADKSLMVAMIAAFVKSGLPLRLPQIREFERMSASFSERKSENIQ
jgi:hypothetical protein